MALLSGAHAGAAFEEDHAQLLKRISAGPECCLVDARGELGRMKGAIPFALQASASLKVKAGAFALVVADSDAAALKVAQDIARRSAGDAIAVKGGYATWTALTQPKGQGSGAATLLRRFTIPSNTCEQGAALQEFNH